MTEHCDIISHNQETRYNIAITPKQDQNPKRTIYLSIYCDIISIYLSIYISQNNQQNNPKRVLWFLESVLLSEKSREHIHPVMLNATFYVGITKLCARLECSKSAAILYALNDGLLLNASISEEDHDLLAKRYGRKLKDVIAEGKENSHTPKLELEKQKREQCQASAQKVRIDEQFEGIKAALKGKYEQWDSHPDLDWRIKTVAYAKKYPEFEYAKLLIEKEKSVVGVS